MDKREKRLFIITLEIESECWDYKIGDIIETAVISNNINNAINIFEDRHWGSEYPSYNITGVYDTLRGGFFMPNILSKDLT
jgi:hypothetical protein